MRRAGGGQPQYERRSHAQCREQPEEPPPAAAIDPASHEQAIAPNIITCFTLSTTRTDVAS